MSCVDYTYFFFFFLKKEGYLEKFEGTYQVRKMSQIQELSWATKPRRVVIYWCVWRKESGWLLGFRLGQLGSWIFPDGSEIKNPPAVQETRETQIWSLGWEVLLEEEMTTYSSILAWKKNPMDRGAWRATVNGVSKSQIQLSMIMRWAAKNLSSYWRRQKLWCGWLDTQLLGNMWYLQDDSSCTSGGTPELKTCIWVSTTWKRPFL